MARHVEDLVVALRILDRARDPALDPRPQLSDPSAVDLGGLRFATFADDGEFQAAPAARRAVAEAAQFLSEAGARPVAWKHPSLSRVNDLFFACLSADRAHAFRRLLHGNPVDPHIRQLLMTARMPAWLRGIAAFTLDAFGQSRSAATARRLASGTADAYWQTVEAIGNFRRELVRSLDDGDGGAIDLILCPAYPVPAVRHGATGQMPMPGCYAPLANVTGLPAGIVPVTRVRPGEESDRPGSRDQVDRVARDSETGSAGLPIAVQVIARPWCDHVALAAMAEIEATARKQPDYPARPPL
jgi:fatty acid amide hydrolase